MIRANHTNLEGPIDSGFIVAITGKLVCSRSLPCPDHRAQPSTVAATSEPLRGDLAHPSPRELGPAPPE